MMEAEQIRNHLRLIQEADLCGLRELEERTGVSFSTLSRFMRGATPNYKTLQRLSAFYKGEPLNKAAKIGVKRFNVGGKQFLITIEEL